MKKKIKELLKRWRQRREQKRQNLLLAQIEQAFKLESKDDVIYITCLGMPVAMFDHTIYGYANLSTVNCHLQSMKAATLSYHGFPYERPVYPTTHFVTKKQTATRKTRTEK